MVKETSKLAYDELKTSGRALTQRIQVLEFIKANQPVTRKQIELGLGIGINAVCGRVKKLMELGMVEVAFKDKCPITGKYVEFLRIKGL
jgi:predicted transcriptional regulator